MDYDVAIIGGGTAGLRGAIRLAHAGKKVLLAEPKSLGGTCLNTGCIPSKALLHAAEMFASMRESQHLGISCSPKVNFSKLMSRVKSLVQEGQDEIKRSVKTPNLHLVKEKARLAGKNKVEVGGKIYSAKRIIIATGSSNAIPRIPGLSEVPHFTSDNILSMETLPKSVICIGGGYISLEYATFFSAMGCKVTVLEAMPRILGMLDEDVLAELLEQYKGKAQFITKANIVSVKRGGRGVCVELSNKTLVADALIVATGRSPNTAGLNLASADVDTDERGAIKIDDNFLTSNRHVYAVGDCTGKSMFAHTAKREIQFVIGILLGEPYPDVDLTLVPWAVYTHPPVAGIGLSEQQAKLKGYRCGILHASFRYVGRAAILGERSGFAKVSYDLKTNNILGATIIGPQADDLIHEIAALMTVKATVKDLHKVIHAHPTLSEIFGELE